MNEHAVYRRARRPDPALIARAAACATSDLYESLDAERRSLALMSPRMRPLMPGIRMSGPAITIRCAPGDNLMMHAGLRLANRGDVLVISGAVERAEARREQEKQDVAEIMAGRSLFEIHDLQGALTRSGVVEIDEAWNRE